MSNNIINNITTALWLEMNLRLCRQLTRLEQKMGSDISMILELLRAGSPPPPPAPEDTATPPVSPPSWTPQVFDLFSITEHLRY